MLQSKFRKLVTLEKSASAFATKLERTSDNIYRKKLWMIFVNVLQI